MPLTDETYAPRCQQLPLAWLELVPFDLQADELDEWQKRMEQIKTVERMQ